MFTLKFIRQGGMQETVVSASWYEVFGADGRFTIVTHQEMPCADGVGFAISNVVDVKCDNHYQQCFVENQKGKTIAAYRAKGYHSINDAPTIADEAYGD
jgi:hypothetical protein